MTARDTTVALQFYNNVPMAALWVTYDMLP